MQLHQTVCKPGICSAVFSVKRSLKKKRQKLVCSTYAHSHSLFWNTLQHQRKKKTHQVLWISSYVWACFYFFPSDVLLLRGLSCRGWVEQELIEDSVLTLRPSPGTFLSVCYMLRGFSDITAFLCTQSEKSGPYPAVCEMHVSLHECPQFHRFSI